MTIIKRTNTPAVGPNVGLLPLFTHGSGVGGVAHRFVASQLSGGAGTKVASWSPAVGTASLTQSTVAAQPVIRVENGQKMVRFDGVDDQLNLTVSAEGLKSIMIIARSHAPTRNSEGLVYTGGGSVSYRPNTTPKQVYVFWLGGTPSISSTAAANLEGSSFHTVTVVGDTASNTHGLSVDGVAAPTPSGASGARGHELLELGRYGQSDFGAIDVLEVVTWSVALTDAQRQTAHQAMRSGYPTLIS